MSTFLLFIIIIIRVFCPRTGPLLQAQEPRLQFCWRQVFHCKLRKQGCSFTRDWIGAVASCCFLFSIWTNLKRSEKIPRAPMWRWGEWIWLTGPSGLHRNSPQGLNISSITVFDQIRDPEIPITFFPLYIHSRTINTLTNLKVNCKHNFKDNLISLLYWLSTSVTNKEHQSFFKMATLSLHTVPKSVAAHLLNYAVSPLGNPPLLSSGSTSGFRYWGASSYRSCLQALPTLGVHWAEVRAAEGPIIPESPGVIESRKSPRARPW